MEVQELRPGLWRWTADHPEWDHAEQWGPEVGSVYAELPDAVVVVDPLVPEAAEDRFWSALDHDVERLGKPVFVLLTVHWHERSVAAVLDLEPYAALVVGDLLVGKSGEIEIELPVEWFPKAEQDWAREQLKPSLRERLGALPIELVLVSHGDPVLSGGAEALERALSSGA